MKLLNVIVSYNLPWYLKNTVDSLLDMFPVGDILIVDNGSNAPDMKPVLSGYEATNPRIKVKRREDNNHGKKVGSLYEAYNEAIDYGLQNNYDLFFFLQDDLQFLWYRDGIVEHVFNVLISNPSISMIQPVFSKKIIEKGLDKRFKRRDDLGTFEIAGYGVCDLGFMTAEFIKKSNFRYLETESDHSRVWLEKGYRIHMLQSPFVACIPWPAVRRRGKIIGREKKPVNKFYYKPLSEDRINELIEMAKRKIIVTEDFCLPWGYFCLQPYWFTECSEDYLKLLFQQRPVMKFNGIDNESHWLKSLIGGSVEPDMAKLIRIMTPDVIKRMAAKPIKMLFQLKRDLMNIGVDEYNAREQDALKRLANRQIESFRPATFAFLGYPITVSIEAELVRYVDTMHEFKTHYFGTDVKYSNDEVDLIKRVCDGVEDLTHQLFGQTVRPWQAPLSAIKMFRILNAIGNFFGKKDLTVFEIGPGSGYLGALLLTNKYRYISTDNTQAFYLWQNRMFSYFSENQLVENALTDNIPTDFTALHLPWWKYSTLYKDNQVKADIVICDHALAEINKYGLKYILRTAKSSLGESRIPLFLFVSPGKLHMSSFEEIHKEFIASGFSLINYNAFFAYTLSGSHLCQYEIALNEVRGPWSVYHAAKERIQRRKSLLYAIRDKVLFYNPSRSEHYFSANDFMDLTWGKSPYDYDYLSYLGYQLPAVK